MILLKLISLIFHLKKIKGPLIKMAEYESLLNL